MKTNFLSQLTAIDFFVLPIFCCSAIVKQLEVLGYDAGDPRFKFLPGQPATEKLSLSNQQYLS